MDSPEFYMKVTYGGAVPADRYSAEMWSRFKIGEVIKFPKPKRTRNISFHNLFFVALNFLFEHQDLYSVTDDLREDIAIELGHFTVETYRGKKKRKAKSISFAAMDEDAFREFFDGFVKLACERIAPQLEYSVFDQFLEILDGNSGKQGQRIIETQDETPERKRARVTSFKSLEK